MKTIAALAMLMLAASPAAAKCGHAFYEFAGAVVDKRGDPAVGVMVGISWLETSRPAGPAIARTDAQGRYTIPIRFDSYSGGSLFRGDVCAARLEEISIAAYTDSHRSDTLRVDVGEDWGVGVPLLAIDRPIARTPLFPDEIGISSSAVSNYGDWRVGSEWQLTIGPKASARVVTVRVEEEPADACLDGEWKRLTQVSGGYAGLSEPAYRLSGDRLVILLAADVCDAHDQLEGIVDGGVYIARHSKFGLGHREELGAAHGVRVE